MRHKNQGLCKACANADAPAAGSRVITPQGPGVVIAPRYCHPYHDSASVRLNGGSVNLYKYHELTKE